LPVANFRKRRMIEVAEGERETRDGQLANADIGLNLMTTTQSSTATVR
jgi:hypothetical protein